MILTMNIQKFATKKWYSTDSEANGNYLPDNEVKFLTS